MEEQVHDVLNFFASSPDKDGFQPERLKRIRDGQRLLSLLPNDHGLRPELQLTLADALYDHHVGNNEWDALVTATEYLEELLENVEEGDNSAAARLSFSYSRCLRNRFMRSREDEHLERAIAHAKKSVSLTRDLHLVQDSELLAARLSNLGLCLFTRGHQKDDYRTLDEAMTINEEACLLLENSKGSDLWIEATHYLQLTFLVKFNQNGSFPDLEKSVELGYQILHTLHENTPLDIWEESLSDVAFGLQRAYKCFLDGGVSFSNQDLPKGEALHDEALKLMTRSVEVPSNRSIIKLGNIYTFRMYIKELPIRNRRPFLGSLYPLLKRTVQLLQDAAFLSFEADRRDYLHTYYGLARYAAAAAIQAGVAPSEVLQLLETGRAVALSIALNSKLDIYPPDIEDTLLDKSYREAVAALNTSITQNEPLYDRQDKLKQLREVQGRIGEQGMAGFDLALGEEAMKNLAKEGVIAVINVTDIRCDAILVDSTRIWTLPLPELTEEKLHGKSDEIQGYLARREDQHKIFPDLWKSLSALLKWLWAVLAQPVLEDLGYQACKSDWPHIWWVPTGVLGLYPIHAIGTGLNMETNVMDRVISSYTPSLRALSQARLRYSRQNNERDAPTTQQKSSPSALVLAMHETSLHAPLNFSNEEAAAVQDRFPNTKVLHEPTFSAACDALQESPEPSIVHFSCHGDMIPSEPFKSTLLLRDWKTHPLTVGALQRLSMENPLLAFLSACFTANAGIDRLQDESEHLASAMQIAGFAAVVGSVWNVDQDAACAVAKEFYKQLPGKDEQGFDVKSVKTALHLAVRAFARTTCNGANRMKGDPVRWAPFIHYGL
ncbi:hypothetical protein MMC30_007184 [Trapelia coarctata]|nr:hypothetical protein [Trapelia coarctata]